MRVEFIRFVHVTLDAEVVIYTPNIFVHDWGTNPIMIYPTISNITRRAYNPITNQRGFVLRCNHKRLKLKRVERKRIGPEIILLESVKTSVTTFLTIIVPLLIMPWVMPPPMIPTLTEAGLTPMIPTDVLQT